MCEWATKKAGPLCEQIIDYTADIAHTYNICLTERAHKSEELRKIVITKDCSFREIKTKFILHRLVVFSWATSSAQTATYKNEAMVKFQKK